ncbi:hypothetical protein D3C76_1522060 [compost metagenome]
MHMVVHITDGLVQIVLPFSITGGAPGAQTDRTKQLTDRLGDMNLNRHRIGLFHKQAVTELKALKNAGFETERYRHRAIVQAV